MIIFWSKSRGNTVQKAFKPSKYCLFRWLKEVGGVTDHVPVGGG